MGTLHYALNHTRKEAFYLDKTFTSTLLMKSSGKKLPETYEEVYAYVWSEMDPDENFVSRDWATPEEAERIAKRLFAFGVEDAISDSYDELINEHYGNYVIVDSIYENDTDIGQLMDMHLRYDMKQDGHPLTMVVQTMHGYERRNVEYIREIPHRDYGRPGIYRTHIPVMMLGEEMYEMEGVRVPYIGMSAEYLHDEYEAMKLATAECTEKFIESRGTRKPTKLEFGLIARQRMLVVAVLNGKDSDAKDS